MTVEPRPYVRYKITADVHDVGVAVSISRAITSYLKANNYAGKLTNFEKSSDSMSAILEIFYNGRDDFNIKTIKHHIEESGRLPTKKNYQPKIEIVPVPCDFKVELETGPDDQSWQRTLEAVIKERDSAKKDLERYKVYNAKQEETIAGINVSLSERIDRVSELEEKLRSIESLTSKTAHSAVSSIYLPQFEEPLFETSADWELVSEENRAIFMNTDSDSIKSFTTYFNYKYKKSFTEDSFREWQEKMEKTKFAVDLPEYQEAEEGIKQFGSVDLLVKQAEELNVPLEIIDGLKDKAKQSNVEIKILKQKQDKIRTMFEKERELYKQIETERNNYSNYMTIVDSSRSRISNENHLPILFSINRDSNKLNIMIPHIGEGHLEPELYHILMDAIGVNDKIIIKEGSLETNTNGCVNEDVITKIESNSLFKKLGLPLEVVVLSEKNNN